MNYIYYGVFAVSDFTQGAFKDAYGALVSVKQENPVGSVALNNETRFKLYEEVPSFALLKDELGPADMKNGYMDKKLLEFKGGSFYWQ